MALMCRSLKSSLRFYRTSAITLKQAGLEKDKKLPHYIEHSTGLERRELLARAAGNDDPFDMKPHKLGKATKEEPHLVPSTEDKRIVGCICSEDATSINWIWIHKDEPKRCYCGYWFKLTEAKAL